MEGTKRGHDADPDLEQPESSKRQRRERNSDTKIIETTDATYGQRYAFASLDEPTAPSSDDEWEVEDESDALAYLRSVRQEADTIPHLLVAPKAGPQLFPRPVTEELDYDDDDNDDAGDGELIDRTIYTSGVGDSRGYYYDGTYTAMPDEEAEDGQNTKEEMTEEQVREEDVRQAYFASLRERFLGLREALQQSPPDEAVLTLSHHHSFEVGSFTSRKYGQETYSLWHRRLRETDPMPAQVASMDRRAVFRLLHVLRGGGFLRHGRSLPERTSRWLWALLARLPDLGELDYADVGDVRELGKRAVLMMTSIAHVAALRGQAGLDDGEVEGVGEFGVDGDDAFPPSDCDDDSACQTEGRLKETAPVAPDIKRDRVANAQAPDGSSRLATDARPEDGGMAGEDGVAPYASDGEAMDLEDGEIDETELHVDASAQPGVQVEDLEAVKARLLAQLDPPINLEPEIEPDTAAGEDREAQSIRARMNMRATLNMILTVAGEFYGQRDLLEFRDTF